MKVCTIHTRECVESWKFFSSMHVEAVVRSTIIEKPIWSGKRKSFTILTMLRLEQYYGAEKIWKTFALWELFSRRASFALKISVFRANHELLGVFRFYVCNFTKLWDSWGKIGKCLASFLRFHLNFNILFVRTSRHLALGGV